MFVKSFIFGLSLLLLMPFAAACAPDVGDTAVSSYYQPVSIAHPESSAELELMSDVSGMIRLIGYSGSEFISGMVEVGTLKWVPEIEETDSKISLVQTSDYQPSDSQNLVNLWKLSVSDSKPFRFTVRNLRAEGHWNFSGLPITDLVTEFGDAKNAITFDEPNLAVMKNWEIVCGKGDVTAEGILNAACQNLRIKAGTGTTTLRFGGKELLHSIEVSVTADTGVIAVFVPPDIPACFTITGECPVMTGEGIARKSATVYETMIYQNGNGNKVISVSISGGTGTIYLNYSP